MAAPGHPNSANPVAHIGNGGYVTLSDAGEPLVDDCPACGGTGKVVRRVITEADLADAGAQPGPGAGRAQAAALAEWGEATGAIRASRMPPA